jgi:hypothetical protein
MAIPLDELAGPEGGDESRRLAKHWLDQIATVLDNSEMKRYYKRGEQIVKRYRDERTRLGNEDGARRYGSLWSNVEILKPALYGREPMPIAERRFKDKDPVARGAASILERALRNEIEICGFNESMSQSVSDYLLPGQGVIWVRYEPEIAEGISLPVESQTDMRDSQGNIPSGSDRDYGSSDDDDAGPDDRELLTPKGRKRPQLNDEDGSEEAEEDPEKELETQKLEDTDDRVVRESTPVDYIPWNDFFTFPVRARIWKEVTAVGKRVYLSRDQLIKRFGKKIGKAIALEKDKRGDRTQNTTMQAADQDKGEVFEIWNRDDQTVYWVAMGYDYLCDRKDDPLNLDNFYPTPKPIYANPTNNTLIPVPDYIQYEDQAIQIDELTQRIAMLTKAAKITGVYNAAAKDIQRMFQESVENELIPVDDWAAFAEEGGVAGNISFMPIKDIVGLINELVMVKSKLLEDMDRLTGINDIMRGTSDARETLGGVRIKSNSTGTRLTQRQNEVARLARDTVRIMADIMCQHFSPQSLIEVSGALYEEGLGPDDMPPLSELSPPTPAQAPPGAAPSAPPQAAGAVPPRPALPAPAMPQNGPPAGPMSMGAPQQPSNVVPFRGQMQPSVPGQAPPSVPLALNGTILPPQPPMPPELLAKMQAMQRISKAIGLLRDERLRGFRVDIEVDSTIFPDAAQDKQDRIEFVASVTKYIGEAAQLGAQVPEAIPLLGKLLQFGARSFRVGRDLETAIEQLCDEMVVEAKKRVAQQQQQPNPEQIKAQVAAAKGQSDIAVSKIKAQTETAKAQADIQSTQLQSTAEARQDQAEIQRAQLDSATEQQNSQADIVVKQLEVKMREMEVQMEQMRMAFEGAKLHQEAMQPPEVPKPAANPAA